MEYKLIWKDGSKKGEFEIRGNYDYVMSEWDNVLRKYPSAKIVWWGHYVYGAWIEIVRVR